MNTIKQDSKKSNSYKKVGIYMLLSAAGGGVLGILAFSILDERIDGVKSAMTLSLTWFQQYMVPLLLAVAIITVVIGERTLYLLKENCRKILATEDEECDRWEYTEEKLGAWGTLTSILSQILSILILSAGYSIRYIKSGHHQNMLTACLIFLACYAYNGFWQTRFVKVVQKAHPEKKGDPSSTKFRQQWLDSCDEAEKEVIYQSAYNTYTQMNRWIPVLLLVTMLGHLFFYTGIMAILTVAVIWLVVTVSYLHSCVKLKGAKLR